ncbi:hypothetical protein [Microbispora siamensis]|uniref:Uncharacterized protein n=1 Tax=Microbispora siamensis TaxID=564413 RepID=A0ABQ4GM61_9ACTN|nr:hypothetical protein [Microbispora siamensis]GIH62502.1 hypothetical protein Msi02_33190 [Microbispora siamensis]
MPGHGDTGGFGVQDALGVGRTVCRWPLCGGNEVHQVGSGRGRRVRRPVGAGVAPLRARDEEGDARTASAPAARGFL